jgi:hypothetical protein
MAVTMACFSATGSGSIARVWVITEKVPGEMPLVRHPWEITVREFVEKVRRDYGIELSVTSLLLVTSLFLRKRDRLYPLLVAEEDDIIPLDVLRSLCKAFGLPPEDFHLDPEEED